MCEPGYIRMSFVSEPFHLGDPFQDIRFTWLHLAILCYLCDQPQLHEDCFLYIERLLS